MCYTIILYYITPKVHEDATTDDFIDVLEAEGSMRRRQHDISYYDIL